MDKKQAGRRPAEKVAEHGPGKFDPNRPEPGRRPEAPREQGFGKPEGQPIDKQLPTPGMRAGRSDILESERSDRESGRPVQLEGEDDEREVTSDAKPGFGGGQYGGRADQKPYEADKPKR